MEKANSPPSKEVVKEENPADLLEIRWIFFMSLCIEISNKDLAFTRFSSLSPVSEGSSKS